MCHAHEGSPGHLGHRNEVSAIERGVLSIMPLSLPSALPALINPQWSITAIERGISAASAMPGQSLNGASTINTSGVH